MLRRETWKHMYPGTRHACVFFSTSLLFCIVECDWQVFPISAEGLGGATRSPSIAGKLMLGMHSGLTYLPPACRHHSKVLMAAMVGSYQFDTS